MLLSASPHELLNIQETSEEKDLIDTRLNLYTYDLRYVRKSDYEQRLRGRKGFIDERNRYMSNFECHSMDGRCIRLTKIVKARIERMIKRTIHVLDVAVLIIFSQIAIASQSSERSAQIYSAEDFMWLL